MDTLTIDLTRSIDLKELMEEEERPCVSIYLPTHKKSDQKRQDPVRFRKLLSRAEQELIRTGLRPADARRMLQQPRGLLETFSFWEHQSEGLAVFLTTETLRYYHLPFRFDELVTAGPRFHLSPLVPLLGENRVFYILELCKHTIRLFTATPYTVTEIDLRGLIPDQAQHMKLHHDLERHFRTHIANSRKATAGKEKKLPYFFGQGASRDCRKEDIMQYFHAVAWAVRGMAREDHHPMVPCGVSYLIDLYRMVNRYPYLTEGKITGSQESTDERRLQKLCWPVVEPIFRRERHAADAAYKGLYGTARVDNRPDRILPAAQEGLLQTLFLPQGRPLWGIYDEKNRFTEIHRSRQKNDQELCNLAALHTISHKGVVYAVPPGDMPGKGALNAIYRY